MRVNPAFYRPCEGGTARRQSRESETGSPGGAPSTHIEGLVQMMVEADLQKGRQHGLSF
ncbi:MAG: hypothetical protein MZU97_03190 [Bacillus subtilis]|nr:hypothetical protein [Bacillus subtilis]